MTAATKLLGPLASQPEASHALRSSVARIYLQGGYLAAAAAQFASIEADTTADESLKKMNKSLYAAAEGDWLGASNSLREILKKDSQNYVVECFFLSFSMLHAELMVCISRP